MPALKAVQPAETPEPASPPEVLAQFCTERDKLQQQLVALARTRDLSQLDHVAATKAKLAHIDELLPELAVEARDWEESERLAAAREKVSPLWAAQAQRKAAARSTIASACKAIVHGIEEYSLAHQNQLHLMDQLGIRRGDYGSLAAQLVAAVHAGMNVGSGTAGEWQNKIEQFDPPGCSATPPSAEIM
jgi:hypothetical protein